MQQGKRVAESRTEQIHLLMPRHINGHNRLFGGKLMEWIDIVAGVVSRRHSNAESTTVAVDNLRFKAPAYMNHTIVLIGQMTYVGKTSMEVRVDTYLEELSGERKMINRAYLVMVALDKDEKPMCVPSLIIETEEEKREWEAGEKRYNLRKQRLLENY